MNAPGGPNLVAPDESPDLSSAAPSRGPLHEYIERIKNHGAPDPSATTKSEDAQSPARKPSGFLARLVEKLRGKRK